MKTAISIPDRVFKDAEQMARRLKCSRSELYTRAIGEFLRKHKQQNITKALNEVYGEEPAGIDEELLSMQGLSVGEEDWS